MLLRISENWHWLRDSKKRQNSYNRRSPHSDRIFFSPVYSDSRNVRRTNAILTHIQIKRPQHQMQRYRDMLGSSRGSRNVTASSVLSSYFNEHVIAYRTYFHSVDRDDNQIHQANRIQLPQLQINKYITRKQTRVLCFQLQIVHHCNSKEHPKVTCGFITSAIGCHWVLLAASLILV